MGAGLGPGGGTNPRPRSARNRRPSGAGSGARQGWGRGMAGALGAGDSGPGSGKRGTGERAGSGKQRWGAALAVHGRRMRAIAHFWLQWGGCCRRRLLRGWLCAGEGGMKKRPHMRPLYVKAISFERLYGKLERELRLSSSRRVPQSSSWGERIRGKLQEPWCQQRCGRNYGIPKP